MTLARWGICLVALQAACGSSNGAPPGPPDASDASSGDSGRPPRDSGHGATDSAAAGDQEAGPVTPTASSWMGTNADVDLPFADVTHLLNGFDTAAAQLDANGYPVAGASGQSQTDVGFLLPTGLYDISYVGTGTLAVSGIGALTGPFKAVSGEQRSQVMITGTPGSFGNFLNLQITNTGSQTVTDVHLYLPGIAYDAKDPFNPAYLSVLEPFRAIRFMGWQATNNSKLADWADAPMSSHFGASANGQPYDTLVDLVNETGKDAWVNVPELATSDFIDQFAASLAKGLDFPRIQTLRAAQGITTPFQVIVENSNETWNMGFSAYTTFLNAANAAGTKYSGTYSGAYGPSWMSGDSDLMKVGQYEADRLVAIGTAFKAAFKAGGQESAVAPVLSGWALGAVYSDDGLAYIKANYGDPKDYVAYVALAPYFATADDSTTGSLATIFPALVANITSMSPVFSDFAKLGKAYGVSIAAYEGGQGITGATNEPIKHLAQFDARMHDTYKQYLDIWKTNFGPSLFMHFDLAGDPGMPENIYQYGFWGSLPGVDEDLTTCGQMLPTLTGTETVASVMKYCPKYQALADRVPE